MTSSLIVKLSQNVSVSIISVFVVCIELESCVKSAQFQRQQWRPKSLPQGKTRASSRESTAGDRSTSTGGRRRRPGRATSRWPTVVSTPNWLPTTAAVYSADPRPVRSTITKKNRGGSTVWISLENWLPIRGHFWTSWVRWCWLVISGHLKNIHLHSCKHKTVKLKLTLTLTLTLTDTGGAVLTLMLGYRRLRNYKLKRKIQIWDCGNIRGVCS